MAGHVRANAPSRSTSEAQAARPSSTRASARTHELSDSSHPGRELQQLADASEQVAGLARVQALADGGPQREAAAGWQALADSRSSGDPSTRMMHRIAALGVRGSAHALPHRERIQASFGAHDVSRIAAHTDASARSSSAALGVRAFASGEHVVFGPEPSLFVAAHEAAHVVQQRAGVQLFGGFGRTGDVYERNADEVASKVVRGESAVSLLDRHASPTRQASDAPVVQCWGEPDHYAMGQLAGFKTLETLATRPATRAKTYALAPDESAPTKRSFLRGSGTDITIDEEVGDDSKFFLRDSKGNPMSYGAANRIAGDLSGRPLGHDMIERAPTLELWPAKIASVRAKSLAKSKPKIAKSGHSMVADDPIDESTDVSTDYAHLSMFGELTLLATNANHFFPLARVEYQRQHQRARQKMWMALQLDERADKKSKAAAQKQANEAMLIEGFAGHFLADCFAAGHLSPHALGRIGDAGGLTSGALVNTWHDLFNALPDGVPTTLGRFHGDYSMDGEDLEYVSGVLANSLLEVVMPWYTGTNFNPEIVLPEPDLPKILADPVVGPLWAAMCGDYASRLEARSTMERRKAKSGLSKYAIFETTTGEQVSKEETITPILEKTFGGTIGVPERDLVEHDLGRIRGKVSKIVGAIAQLLDYRDGWQPASGLGKDFEPVKGLPLTAKFKLDLKSAKLASKSPASAPLIPLLRDLAHWLDSWASHHADTKAEETLREDIALLLELGTELASAKSVDDLEPRRQFYWRIARAVESGLASLGLPIVFDAESAKYDQGPDSSLRRGQKIRELTRAYRDEQGDEAPLAPLVASFPRALAGSSGMVIPFDVSTMAALHRWRPEAALAYAQLRNALEALASDPRPNDNGEHETLYALVSAAIKSLATSVNDIEAPTAAALLVSWCEALDARSKAWWKLGKKVGKTAETSRREVLFDMRDFLDLDPSPFSLDVDQLYRSTGRKLAEADADFDE